MTSDIIDAPQVFQDAQRLQSSFFKGDIDETTAGHICDVSADASESLNAARYAMSCAGHVYRTSFSAKTRVEQPSAFNLQPKEAHHAQQDVLNIYSARCLKIGLGHLGYLEYPIHVQRIEHLDM